MSGETVAGAIAEWHTVQYYAPHSTMRILQNKDMLDFITPTKD